jgi:predicted signal transduction protein with EAL and GGDEF domain
MSGAATSSVLCWLPAVPGRRYELRKTFNIRSTGNSIALLRRLGCRYALDDFGSGLGSLGCRKHPEIDDIKIDAGFISTPRPIEDLFKLLRRKRSLVLSTS